MPRAPRDRSRRCSRLARARCRGEHSAVRPARRRRLTGPIRAAPPSGLGRRPPSDVTTFARPWWGHGQRCRSDDHHRASATCSCPRDKRPRRTTWCSRWCPFVRRLVRGVYNNRVSAVFAGLPGGRSRRPARTARSHLTIWTASSKQSAVAGDLLSALSGFAPPMLLAVSAAGS